MKTANIRNFAEEFAIPNIPLASRNQRSTHNLRCDIFDRNFDIIYRKMYEKITCWEVRLNIQGTQLLRLIDKLEKHPQNKSLFIKVKKMKRSYADSLISFFNFVNQTKPSAALVPSEPLSDKSFLDNSISKTNERNSRKVQNKNHKNTIRNARRKKYEEHEFFMEKNDMNYNVEESEELCLNEYQEYLEAKEDLIKAEKALHSPVIFEAAWAIHDGTEEKNIDIIYDASLLFEDYIKAVSRYNELIENYR